MKIVYKNCGVKNNVKEDHRSYRRNFCSCEKKAWKKKLGLYGIPTLDLRDSGATLYQLSQQWGDLLSYNSSLRSSHISFSYIVNFIIILSRIYSEPIQRSLPTWLVGLIGRVLQRHSRGQGFKSCTSLNFFQTLTLKGRNWQSMPRICSAHILTFKIWSHLGLKYSLYRTYKFWREG